MKEINDVQTIRSVTAEISREQYVTYEFGVQSFCGVYTMRCNKNERSITAGLSAISPFFQRVYRNDVTV
jgi:hypothetical protein